jgi:hypothetical protein
MLDDPGAPGHRDLGGGILAGKEQPLSDRSTTVATLWFVLLPVAVTGPALFLDRSLRSA